MDNQPIALGLKGIRTEGLREDFRDLADCLVRLPLALNIDGVWYDRETGKMIRQNHVKCILRNDYKSRYGKLSGSRLDKHIDSLLNGALRATVDLVKQKRTDKITMLDVVEEYI